MHICIVLLRPLLYMNTIYGSINEPVHENSINVVCETNKASDQPTHTHTRSLIRAFA